MIETKRKSLILNVVLTAIILVIGFLFWPSSTKFNQSNPRDVNKNQIKIKVKALNIRKEASIDSKDIGTVYYDEIFTVLSHVDKEDYYWYQIKTKQGVEGYIASDRNSEYIEVISGQIDREAPTIKSSSDLLVFIDGEPNYDAITCEDNYTKCTLSYDDSNPEYIIFKGVDEDGNESTFKINYYKAYNINTIYNDKTDSMHVSISKKTSRDKYLFETNYAIDKVILSENKSKQYTPIIDLFDENFNKIDTVNVSINSESLSGTCINNSNNVLKPEFINNDLLKGSTLCINYAFKDDENIKYVAFGFQGVENYDNLENGLASYYSKYFIF